MGFPRVVPGFAAKMAAREKSLDPDSGVDIGAIRIDGFRRRETSTTVELRDGESFAIAGLLQDDFRDLMEALQTSTLAGGLVARAAARLLQKEDKERSGVVSTAQSHTHFLDSPRMAEALGVSVEELIVSRARRSTR